VSQGVTAALPDPIVRLHQRHGFPWWADWRKRIATCRGRSGTGRLATPAKRRSVSQRQHRNNVRSQHNRRRWRPIATPALRPVDRRGHGSFGRRQDSIWRGGI